VGSIVPTLLILAGIFIPLGIGIWLNSKKIPEVTIEYTNCTSLEYPDLTCEEVIGGAVSYLRLVNMDPLANATKECHCRVDFELEEDMNVQ
jgi:hypothetical protein